LGDGCRIVWVWFGDVDWRHRPRHLRQSAGSSRRSALDLRWSVYGNVRDGCQRKALAKSSRPQALARVSRQGLLFL